MSGLMIAAPSSGAGKTTVTLALLAALSARRLRVRSAKAGPDYIDPAFHAAASGGLCVNLDPWAMRRGLIETLAARQIQAAGEGGAFVVEAMMGLFDGAADGTGSAADLAALLALKIVLVVDCAKQSHSVAALVGGFDRFRDDTRLSGLILNRVGSKRHEQLLREALAPVGVPVLGVLGRRTDLALPERHLGLVQAAEKADLRSFLDRAASWAAEGANLDALARLAACGTGHAATASTLPPLGQRIALARDEAFAFSYPHLLEAWREAGAEILPFSPLADEAPDPAADAVYLPGGYPELHAGRLSTAGTFASGMRAAAERGALIYGECGGYMTLGRSLTDAEGTRHSMLGLLPLETSFAQRRLHLGYRRLAPLTDLPFATPASAHEFHYATVEAEGPGDALFSAIDARGESLGPVGLRRANVCGSFMHLIDRASA